MAGNLPMIHRVEVKNGIYNMSSMIWTISYGRKSACHTDCSCLKLKNDFKFKF